jgi:hypothetical protein
VARVDVHEVDVVGLGELGDVTGADPLLSLGGGEFGAHEYDRDVEPSLVHQAHQTLGHSCGDRNRGSCDAAPGLLIEVGGVRPLERAPAGERHDTVLRLEEVGVGFPVGGREAADEDDFGHLLRSRVGGQPSQGAGGGMPHHHGLFGCRVNGREHCGHLVVERGRRSSVALAGKGERHGAVAE